MFQWKRVRRSNFSRSKHKIKSFTKFFTRSKVICSKLVQNFSQDQNYFKLFHKIESILKWKLATGTIWSSETEIFTIFFTRSKIFFTFDLVKNFVKLLTLWKKRILILWPDVLNSTSKFFFSKKYFVLKWKIHFLGRIFILKGWN